MRDRLLANAHANACSHTDTDTDTDADAYAATARYRFGHGQRNGDDEILEPWTDSFEGLSSGAVQLSGGYEDYSVSASTVALANQKIASESHTFFQHPGPDRQSERFDQGTASSSGSMDFSIAVYGPASIAVPLQLSGQLDANVYVRVWRRAALPPATS